LGLLCKRIEIAAGTEAASRLDANDFFNIDNVMPGRRAESCARAAADQAAQPAASLWRN